MSSKFLTDLSNDYEKLFETELGYDVIIYAGEEQDVKEIHVHSNILCIRSKYFRTAFSNEWTENRDGKFNYLILSLEFLIKHQTEFLYQDPTGILEIIYHYETFTDLLEFCLENICKEPKILFQSDKFINLKAPLLELLFKRDELNMDEIEIY
ncbi:hypothetical protein C1645_830121 [Glomus cerebriforme]|uniref:BTB domain-containing protein n=1 Tax=Glomus cerebriforme TaxID=658196 RepID=A0A397SI95_9GLOM|nr:hypothetical protein C1645_830121 [Glomus cerebriforme]